MTNRAIRLCGKRDAVNAASVSSGGRARAEVSNGDFENVGGQWETIPLESGGLRGCSSVCQGEAPRAYAAVREGEESLQARPPRSIDNEPSLF